MKGYKPPFELTTEIIDYVSSISEKVGKISAINNGNVKPHLRKINRIKSIHSSLKIEANSLSLSQVRDVVDGKIVIGEQKEIQEVKNAFEAYEKLADINPYSLECLKSFHGIMTKYIIDESGEFRMGEEGVFDGDVCVFVAPPARLVPKLMQDLFEWMKNNHNSVHPLIMSAVFHYEFVFIHPFTDGNGRMARLWHSAMLAAWKPIFEYIPLESQIEKCQTEYYETIAKCHSEGSSTSFIVFALKQIDKILDDVAKQSDQNYANLSEYVKRLIDGMEYGVPYSALTLMEMVNIKSRASFRKNYLVPALKLNLIKMTIPDKPNSKNQRYIKQ